MVGMWLARHLIDEDDDIQPMVQDRHIQPHNADGGEHETDDGTDPQEHKQPSFFSDLQKIGGQLFSEGGTFLSEMNDTVFNGAVGELLAPSDSIADMQGVGVTVGVLGSSEVDHDEAIDAVAHYLARKGYNMLTCGPTGISSCACESYIETDDRKGRCVGVFPMNEKMKSEGGLKKFVDIPIYAESDKLLDTVVASSDLLVVFAGDDDFLLDSLERIQECSTTTTPCVMFGDEQRYQKYSGIFRKCKYVASAEDVARFVAAATTVNNSINPSRLSMSVSMSSSSSASNSTSTSSSRHKQQQQHDQHQQQQHQQQHQQQQQQQQRKQPHQPHDEGGTNTSTSAAVDRVHSESASSALSTSTTTTTPSTSSTTTSRRAATMSMSEITTIDVDPVVVVAPTKPQPQQHQQQQRHHSGRVSPLSLDDLASYELVESPSRSRKLSSNNKQR